MKLRTMFAVWLTLVAGESLVTSRGGPPMEEKQAAGQAETTGESPAWIDHWRRSTISFGQIAQDPQNRNFFKVVGTGVIVAVDTKTGFIVTARHVFFDPAKNWAPESLRVRFPWHEQHSTYDELGIEVPLTQNGVRLWSQLDEKTDLAAIPVPASFQGQPLHAIFLEHFAAASDLYEGSAIVVLGYPGVVGNQYLVRPIVRNGIVAWTNPTAPH